MSLPPEIIMERKKNRSKLALWQFGAIIAITVAVASIFGKKDFKAITPSAITTNYIASITIDDEMIIENDKRDKIIAGLKDDKYAKAVIVNLNCPGGTAVGSEIIYKILRDIGKEKPVVSVMNSIATSGAYMIALAGDYILAHNTTLTGSIGVLIRSFEATELADKVGIKFINLKTNQNKAALSPTEKLTPEVEAVVMESLLDTYDYFTSLVIERRKLSREEVDRVADGRVFTGNQALKLKLIDAIGTQKDAVEWLKKNKNIPATLEVKEVSLRVKPTILEELLGEISGKIKTQFSSSAKGFLMIYNP
jgi:protease-4